MTLFYTLQSLELRRLFEFRDMIFLWNISRLKACIRVAKVRVMREELFLQLSMGKNVR